MAVVASPLDADANRRVTDRCVRGRAAQTTAAASCLSNSGTAYDSFELTVKTEDELRAA
jgi:hypothetical protein